MAKQNDVPKDHPILIPPTGKRLSLKEIAESPNLRDTVDKVLDQLDGPTVSAFNSSI